MALLFCCSSDDDFDTVFLFTAQSFLCIRFFTNSNVLLSEQYNFRSRVALIIYSNPSISQLFFYCVHLNSETGLGHPKSAWKISAHHYPFKRELSNRRVTFKNRIIHAQLASLKNAQPTHFRLICMLIVLRRRASSKQRGTHTKAPR